MTRQLRLRCAGLVLLAATLTSCGSSPHPAPSRLPAAPHASPPSVAPSATDGTSMGATATTSATKPRQFSISPPGIPATGGQFTLSCTDTATLRVQETGAPERTVSCPGNLTWHEGPGPRDYTVRTTSAQPVTFTWSITTAPQP